MAYVKGCVLPSSLVVQVGFSSMATCNCSELSFFEHPALETFRAPSFVGIGVDKKGYDLGCIQNFKEVFGDNCAVETDVSGDEEDTKDSHIDPLIEHSMKSAIDDFSQFFSYLLAFYPLNYSFTSAPPSI
ncbi:hypothetical protein ACTXT7_011204 [Hymenolepis weldensis]